MKVEFCRYELMRLLDVPDKGYTRILWRKWINLAGLTKDQHNAEWLAALAPYASQFVQRNALR